MISSPSKWTTAEDQSAIGRDSSQLDQRTLSLSTLSQRPGCDDPKGGTESRDGASVLSEPRRCSLEGSISERPRGERLCEIGETPRLERRGANGRVVVPSHVDDRHRNVRCFETVPQLDAVNADKSELRAFAETIASASRKLARLS